MNRMVMRMGIALLASLALSACQQDEASSGNTTGPATAGSETQWAGKSVDGVLQLEWKDLLPSEGNSETLYHQVSRQSLLTPENEDPFSKAILAAAHAVSSRAPVVESLNGKRIRLAGLVVPLEGDGEQMSEFLLVPYFGACVHVPPPPSNQIVYVKTGANKVDEPVLFGSVTVTGTLLTVYSHNEAGDTGYTLEAETVEPYE